MEHAILVNFLYVISLCITFTIIIMFPGISLQIWQIPIKKLGVLKAKRLEKRSRRADEKLKKYCVIDMTKFK